MKIPKGKTEQEVLDAIERVVENLAPGFVFGCYDLDDIKQIGRMKGLDLIESGKYDAGRPLENYLYTHIKRRLINHKRDKLRRTDSPCAQCQRGDFCGGGVLACAKFSEWLARNDKKADLARAAGHEAELEDDTDFFGAAEKAEILAKIDAQLPVSLRKTYLKMRDGVRVSSEERQKVLNFLKNLFGTAEVDEVDE